MEEFFRVGVVTSTHGLKGEVKVYPTTDEPKRFSKLKELYVEKGGSRQKLSIRSVRFFKNMVIVGFKGLERIEDVEGLKGCDLYVERADALPLGENEYYIADLIGLRVLDPEGALLGVLTDVMTTGANDVYCIQNEKYGEILIPAIRDCIKKIDIEKGLMTAELLPGLIPEAAKETPDGV